MVEQVFPWIGGIWWMHNTDTQSTVEGRQEAKGQEKIFMFKFFFSCHKMGSQRVRHDWVTELNWTAIKYGFYFTPCITGWLLICPVLHPSPLHRCHPLVNTLHTKLYLSTASEPPSLWHNEPETIHRHRHPDKQQRSYYKSLEIYSIQYKILGQMSMWKR